MNFATDRDLLMFEPHLFRDVPLISQQRLNSNDAQLASGVLICGSANFVSLGVTVGDVVLANDQPLEVLARTDAQTLSVSLIRADITHAAIPPADAGQITLVIRSFQPQITLVHNTLLRLIGIDPQDPDATFGADAIVSTSLMAKLETLGALEHIYTASFALTGENQTVQTKADHYHKQFQQALAQANISIDVDADGQVDRQAQPAVAKLIRR